MNTEQPAVYIGLVNPKSPTNVGMVMRAAGCYEAQGIFYSGQRFDRARKFATDTKNTLSKIPLSPVDDTMRAPIGNAKRIAIELVEGATPLMEFCHPAQGFYIFGPEDGSLTSDILDSCDYVVYVPTIGCMNLAATVNVVLYDRMAKLDKSVVSKRPVRENRDNNNKLKI